MESAENSSETSPDSGNKRVEKTGCGDEGTGGGGMVATMRRLKIQENLLETAARSTIDDQHLKVFVHAIATKRNRDCMEIKNTFHALKSLLNKFKYSVSSPECLRKMDIKEYKEMAVELDTKIISFKRFLVKELNVLRGAEKKLTTELKEAECERGEITVKVVAKPYTAIVPSPVKITRNTSSGCPEVHRFQEFLNSCGGHRGGWGEQEHALFLSCRRHCAGAGARVGGTWLDRMVEILVEKIPGLAKGEVLKHETWYGEYKRLKAEQRAALELWRGRRQHVKQQFRRFELDLLERARVTQNIKPTKSKTSQQRTTKERKSNVGEITESRENNITTLSKKRTTETNKTSLFTTRFWNNTSNTQTEDDNVDVYKDIVDCQLNTNLQDNEELNQKEVVQFKNVGNYLKPTKTWSIKIEKDDNGLVAKDFRLNIPMANAPKLGISNWRRCLVEEL